MSTLPPWDIKELPEPLPFSLKNLLHIIGPGAILLASSIGGGEWLVGPAIGVRHGASLLWIATVAIFLQLIFNLEAIRYTLYTGEPIVTGFMRLKPSSSFWGTIYTVLNIAQLGLPALAAGSATAVFAAFAGRMPAAGDTGALAWTTYAVILGTLVLLLFGNTIERTLELLSWGMIIFIFIFLVVVNIFFVPLSNWITTLAGFASFGTFPGGTDLVLIGALAASAGSGGMGNLAISNWFRDKGFGMGVHAGAISSATSSHGSAVRPTGSVFVINKENLRRWKLWWSYVNADQIWLWALGCFVGMFLNVNLAISVVPAGTDISSIGAGAYQAQYMAQHLWSGFWFLALLNGFWILFSTHLGNTEMLVRMTTDIAWAASPTVRGWVHNNARSLYYTLFAVFTVWAMIVVNWGTAMDLLKLLGNIAGFILAVSSVQILVVNTTLLPKELQPPLWRKLGLIACSLFYTTMFVIVLRSQL